MLVLWQRRSITALLILIGGSSRTVEFSGVLYYFTTDHRLVAKLRICIRFNKLSKYTPPGYHHEKSKDPICVVVYAVAASNNFEVLGTHEGPGELWDTSKR